VPDPGIRSSSSRDLAPADTALLDLDKVLALITTDGGPTSHTAILAREVDRRHRRRGGAKTSPTARR
jgi:phosphotransferase system enzyme I (PtsI)